MTTDSNGDIGPSELVRAATEDAAIVLPDMTEVWERFPTVTTDSGRFLEEDR